MAGASDASHSAIGYLFQCRMALLLGIKALKNRPSLEISIEKYDDISFVESDEPIECIQTKHHSKPSNLTDQSVDLWKTIGIWCDRVHANPSSTLDTQFSIITTSQAPQGSAASLLRPHRSQAQISEATSLLISAAQASANVSTAAHRAKFLGLSVAVRDSLINAIVVFDQAPNIIDVRSEIENECVLATTTEHLVNFVDYFEGWWFASIMVALTNGATIPVQRIRAKIDDLRESFKLGALPIEELDTQIEIDVATQDNRTFVRQLRALKLSDQSISSSIRDYYRCSEQRSRWARENLLLDGETERYDRNLVDLWERHFITYFEDHSPLEEEASKIKCGRAVFRWANTTAQPFRNRGEIWLSAGAFQILADNVRVGWHPDFRKLFLEIENA